MLIMLKSFNTIIMMTCETVANNITYMSRVGKKKSFYENVMLQGQR